MIYLNVCVPSPFEIKDFIFAEPFDVILYAAANVHSTFLSIQHFTIFYCLGSGLSIYQADNRGKVLVIESFSTVVKV